MIPALLSLTLGTAQAQDKTLFAGTVATEETQTLDTLAEYKQKDGFHVLTETVVSPQAQILSLGTQSQILKTPVGEVQANASLDLSAHYWGYTAYVQDALGNGRVRLGALQDTDTLGAFVGGGYTHSFFTVDADIWHDGTNLNGHGYAALVLDSIYASVGGDPRKQTVNASFALLRPHAFGVYADINVDIENQTQGGKFFIADKSTITRATGDFFQHLTNATELRGVTSGYVLDSWGPFDAYRTDRFGAAVRWGNTPEDLSVKVMTYARPKDTVFVGLGARDVYTRATENHSLGVDLEVYTAIPQTPLETWASTDIDLQTKQANIQLYVGGNWSF